jgi:tetratricopeptide (TPR) repeat protein
MLAPMAEDRLETAATATDTGLASGDDLPPGDVGRYQLRAEVARGGVGRVIAARDLRLGRDVAIKEVLHRGDGEARLVREALIAARLQHPAIVPIFDAGRRPDGAPFVAMKLVEGRTLRDAVAAAPTLRERLALLPHAIAVAEAIAYAHSRGVIHRDLKPGNVLVGAFGETAVVDWGLAKELGAPDDEPGQLAAGGGYDWDATRDGTVLGTPAYMPPEQARGEAVGARADVYALGALLYHLLSGAAPYERGQVTAKLLAGPPPALEARQPGVPPDLAAIVAKAMARDPADRYPDAGPLADDLRRFQTGKLVSAHEYSPAALALRWLRRHRAVVSVAAAAALALAAGGALAVRRVVAERDRAERQLAAAEGLSEFMLSDLRGRLAAVGRLDLLGPVGDRLARYYDALPADAVDQAARRRRARALEIAGTVRVDSGDLEGGRALLARAVPDGDAVDESRILTRLAAIDDDEGHPAAAVATLARARDLVAGDPGPLARVEARLGQLYDKQGRPEAAIAQMRIALDLQRGIVAAAPPAGDAARDLVGTERVLSRLMKKLGRFDEGRALDDDAVARCAAALRERPDDPTWTEELARSHLMRAQVMVKLGRFDDASADGDAAVAASRRLVARDADNLAWAVELGEGLIQQSEHFRRHGNAAAALAVLLEADARIAPAVARDPRNFEWRHDLWFVRHLTASALDLRGDEAGAVAALTAALAVLEPLVAAAPANGWWQVELGETLTELAEIELGARHLDSGAFHVARAVAVLERRAAAAPGDSETQKRLGAAYAARAWLAADRERWPEAVADTRRVLALDQALVARSPEGVEERLAVVRDQINLGQYLGAPGGSPAEARAAFRAGLALYDAIAAEGRLPAELRGWRARAEKLLAQVAP